MVDANQAWDVDQAIEAMRALAPSRPLWIEEPTSPDDILGHARIARALEPLGIRVATGEHCHNRVMFKQFLQADAIGFCQIDTCRLGGVNEVLAVLLLGGEARSPGLPARGRRRPVRVRPAPRDLRLHRGQRLARRAGRRVRRPPPRALRRSGRRPRRAIRGPRGAGLQHHDAAGVAGTLRVPRTAPRGRARRTSRARSRAAALRCTRMSGRLAGKGCLITGAGSGHRPRDGDPVRAGGGDRRRRRRRPRGRGRDGGDGRPRMRRCRGRRVRGGVQGRRDGRGVVRGAGGRRSPTRSAASTSCSTTPGSRGSGPSRRRRSSCGSGSWPSTSGACSWSRRQSCR